MKNNIVILVVLTLLFLLAGCSMFRQKDGTLIFKLGMSPETHAKIQSILDGATDAASGASAYFPALLPIATALGVGGGVWRKMRGKITQKEEPLKMLVGVMEHLKQTDQATWDKIKEQIKAQYPDLELKATIEKTLIELRKKGKLVQTNVVGA